MDVSQVWPPLIGNNFYLSSAQMENTEKTVFYCSVSVGGRVIADYSTRDPEVDVWAALCLEKAPQLHARYFQKFRNRIFAFLMEDDHTFFMITDGSFERKVVFEFLGLVRQNFKIILQRYGAVCNSDKVPSIVRKALLPVLHNLVQSLEGNRTGKDDDHTAEKEFQNGPHVAIVSEIIHDDQEIHVGESEQVDLRQNTRNCCFLPSNMITWCQGVWILLAVDVVFCLILFGIWFRVCDKFSCLSK